MRCVSETEVASNAVDQAWLPSDCRVFAHAAPRSALCPAMAILAPIAASPRHTASPMPPYPPVTRATLPSSLNNSLIAVIPESGPRLSYTALYRWIVGMGCQGMYSNLQIREERQ